MKQLFEKVFGANFRTSLTAFGTAIGGLLAALAAAPYQLGDVALLISPEWKARVFAVSLVATFIMKVWNGALQKDKAVSGNASEGYMVGTKADEPPRMIPNVNAAENAGTLPADGVK